MTTSTAMKKYWLLKAEPDSRVVKGKDVKFSVDDFESVRTSPWEGVRSYEARNLMKEMKEGDKALFYHSNCKTPGIAAFAQVSKEAYPDYTAWDPSHPYYDPKSNSEEPRWFMVDLTFTSRAKHFIPLALLRVIADLPPSAIPEEISYVGEKGIEALKGMDLVTRGRLSVQRVDEDAWSALVMLSEKGGFEDMDLKPKKKGTTSTKGKEKKASGASTIKSPATKKTKSNPKVKALKKKKKVEEDEDEEESEESEDGVSIPAAKRKREAEDVDIRDDVGLRRSTRRKK